MTLAHSASSGQATALEHGRMAITVDSTADLNDEDETGFVWTFPDEARDPSVIVPGAIVTADDADAPTVVEVVDIVPKPSGEIVHLRMLPGRRTLSPA